MTQTLEEKVREAYTRHGGDVAKTASDLGLSPETVRQLFTFPQTVVTPDPSVWDMTPPTDRLGRLAVGRKSMRDKIVAVHHVNMPWSIHDRQAITIARKQYDRGTHDMVTGRDGPWIILYSIKRRRPEAPRNYFYEPRL